MTQLIIDGLYLPQTSRGRYRCRVVPMQTQVVMANGRMVTEIIGDVWEISYSYEHMDDAIYRALLGKLRSHGALPCVALPDDSDTMITGDFICTVQPKPTFSFAQGSRAIWSNVAFTLREVRPHA